MVRARLTRLFHGTDLAAADLGDAVVGKPMHDGEHENLAM
jgi:hypothetical protein